MIMYYSNESVRTIHTFENDDDKNENDQNGNESICSYL